MTYPCQSFYQILTTIRIIILYLPASSHHIFNLCLLFCHISFGHVASHPSAPPHLLFYPYPALPIFTLNLTSSDMQILYVISEIKVKLLACSFPKNFSLLPFFFFLESCKSLFCIYLSCFSNSTFKNPLSPPIFFSPNS